MTYRDQVPPSLGEWLEEQPARAPDGLLDAVVGEVGRTRQRGRLERLIQASPPLGSQVMRVFGTVAVLGLVAVLAFAAGSGQPAVGPGPSPTTSQSAAASTSPRWTSWTLGDRVPFFVSATLAVPDSSIYWFATYQGEAMAEVWSRDRDAMLLFTNVVLPFEDPCDQPPVPVDPGPSVDELVGALERLPVVASPAIDTIVGGYPAKHLALAVPATGSVCAGGPVPVWKWPDGYRPSNVHPAEYSERYYVDPAQPTNVWVVDVAGTRVVVVMDQSGHAQEDAQLQQMFDSLSLAPIQ